MSLARLPMAAERINRKHDDYSLLDAGCRTRDLEPLLKGCRNYFGTDLVPGDGVLQCNLEVRLPFEDDTFDVVAALDVLEHLDNPHGALHELYRVARRTVLISLPNIHYISFRWRFLRGHGLSGKYRFSPDAVLDRHRWVLSYEEAVGFIYRNSHDYGIEHEMILPVRGRTKWVSSPIEAWLGERWPDLFAYGVLFEISLTGSSE